MDVLKRLFRRQAAAPAPKVSPGPAPAPAAEPPLSPEALEELRNAWDDLEAAAKDAGTKSIQACSRSGTPWQKDPAAVRAIAAAIRSTSEPAAQTPKA